MIETLTASTKWVAFHTDAPDFRFVLLMAAHGGWPLP